MRALFALICFAAVFAAGLRAEEANADMPPMGPPTTPVRGGSNNDTPSNPVRTPVTATPLPTPDANTRPTVVAEQPGKIDPGVVVNPKPKIPDNGGTPVVAANANNGNGNGNGGTGKNNPPVNGAGNGGSVTGGNVQPNVQVFDLALNATQEFEVSSSSTGGGSYQFPSGGGTVSLQIGTDGSLTMTGISGQVDLQCQTQPLPIAGVINENQQLKIVGVTKFIAKKVDNRIFVSLRVNPDTITISYQDLTPPNQTTPKENYTFRFLMVGHPPILIVNGQTIQLVQGNDGLVTKKNNAFANILSIQIYRQSMELSLTTGGSLKGYPTSP